MRTASTAVIALAALGRVATAEPFADRSPWLWLEAGGGYGRSIDAGDAGDAGASGASVHMPSMGLAAQLQISRRLSLVGELELPLPLVGDGVLLAGLGAAVVIPLGDPAILDGEIAEGARRIRAELELVARLTGGRGWIFNDLSEGYIETSEQSFEDSGLYTRVTAGLRWRLDSDGGAPTSVAVGLYPAITALRGTDRWHLGAGTSLAASLGF
jgi:hypothetical protein